MNKQFKLFSLIVIIIVGTLEVAGLFSSVANATYVEGPITQNTTWTLVDSPFIVSKDVVVNPSVQLTIEPGVEVRFGGNFSLLVEGILYASGTQDKPITFTSNRPIPAAGDWTTIRFSSTLQSTLTYCSITYAINGITVVNGKLLIQNSRVNANSQNGVFISNSEVTVENNEIANNLGVGIFITGVNQATIQNNNLKANADGILLTSSIVSGVDLRQNLFSLNTQSGIQLDADVYSNLVILYNTISSNNIGFHVTGSADTLITNNSISYNGIGIFYENGEDHVARFNDIYGNDHGVDTLSDATIDATYNYWGHETGPYHASLNPDGKGDPVGGNGVDLDFIFFLTAPIGYINQRPIANLLSDARVVRPSQAVTFFSTGSTDDLRIDQYYFDFGDGRNSSWTTLSVFGHAYSALGTYYATLVIRDDFGVASTNLARLRIDVQDLPSLATSITPSSVNMSSGSQRSFTIYASDGFSPASNANITLLSITQPSITGGSFAPSYGLTNTTGYFTSLLTAPDVPEKTYVRVVATASKAGYTDGSSYAYVRVLPILSVSVTLDSALIKSEAATNGTVHVAHQASLIEGAYVRLSLDMGGTLLPETGSTDSEGDFSFSFIAPQTLTQLNITITATATKNDYWEGVTGAKLTVDPKRLTVLVSGDPASVQSLELSNVTVHVTSDGLPIANAAVSVLLNTGENFSGNTDSRGDFRFIVTSPETAIPINLTVSASALKSGYVAGQGEANILVNPIPGQEPTSVLGLPFTTLLLIIIPVAIVAIIAVLIKAKVIVISREHEQE